jgi:arsenite methyltransferase
MQHAKAEPDAIRQLVRKNYAKIASAFGTCCNAGAMPPCCSGAETAAHRIGYSHAQIEAVPDASTMGLGCGNPQAIARLKPGETVLDLGSGAGFDCFLAAKAVGETGRVIGVDMTDGMVRKARRNAKKANIGNVSFRTGEIEHLPLADVTVDVIMSNCVINLSPEKEAVFREAYRVLKPGGRLAISDVVAVHPLPASMRRDSQMHCACIGGAALVTDLRQILKMSGFEKIEITLVDSSRDLIRQWAPGKNAQDYVVSAFIEAIKPAKNSAR